MKSIKEYEERLYPLLKELCNIPAPSHHEERRAQFCKKYFDALGYTETNIDEANNVVCEVNCDGSDEITVFAAHTDTVFPDMEPMPFYEEGDRSFCPGIGDDTASLAVLLVTAAYFRDCGFNPPRGVIFLCNSCEEGLGNLKGTRTFMEKYKGRIAGFVTYDSSLDVVHEKCVGSHRYKVEVKTKGGHSFSAFGNENAIAKLAEIISELYKIEVPVKGDSKTTYNVGIVEGGTSINTIAQSAKVLCEYRSDDVECLKIMEEKFFKIFEKAQTDKVSVSVEKIGERPCEDGVNQGKLERLTSTAKSVIEEVIKKEVRSTSASTDCNIPLSQGIPAVAVGVYYGGGAHTREEWIETESIKTGLEVSIKLVKALTEEGCE